MNLYSVIKKILLSVSLLFMVSCDWLFGEELPPMVHPEWCYRAVVYEMNLRRQSAEGTFVAAEEQLERLSDLGVDILCLMPIYPIGKKNCRGTYGSPYAVRDYRSVNPDMGTMDDFGHFLKVAHEEDFHVLIDWVAACTSADAVWTKEQSREWYCSDDKKYVDEHRDRVRLDYRNPEMKAAMIDAMKFWVEKGVDGFRCCEVERVPLEFWKDALAELRKVNPDLYFIADSEGNELYESGFNATYALSLSKVMEEVVQGKKRGSDVSDFVVRMLKESPPTAIHLTFTSHHGTLEKYGNDHERWGKRATLMTALTYMLPRCQPMIYTGQEVGCEGRVRLCEKDAVTDWSPQLETNFYRRMNYIKHEMEALCCGERGGEYYSEWGARSEVMTYRLHTLFSRVFCSFNFSDSVSYQIASRPLDMWWNEGASGDRVSIERGDEMPIEPWTPLIYYTGYAP